MGKETYMGIEELNEYLTFDEIKEEFPHATFILKWNAHTLVEVYKSHGLDGVWNNTLKRYVFTRGSVIHYIQYVILKNRRKLKTIESELVRKGISPDL